MSALVAVSGTNGKIRILAGLLSAYDMMRDMMDMMDMKFMI